MAANLRRDSGAGANQADSYRFGPLAGILAARTLLTEESSAWLRLAVCVPVGLTVYLLLYKDRVTANRPKRERKNPFR